MSDDLFSRSYDRYDSDRSRAASSVTVADQPVIIDPNIKPEVERYTQWLQLNNRLTIPQQRLQAYQNEALTVKKVKSKEIRPFAPFQEKTSALRVITVPQVVILAFLGIGIIAGFAYFHLTMLTILLAAITVLYICGFTASSLMATNSFRSEAGESIDEDIIKALDKRRVEWPTYTILCPLYKEMRVAPQFVRAIKALDYPQDKLQVLFLTEENDNETRTALYGLHLPSNFNVLIVPKGTPQTKPRACNFGLLQAKGQFIVIFDAEDKPEPYQLKKAVLTFANHGSELACVQAKLNYYNANQNVLTRLFTAEYSTWFDIMLPGLQRTGFSLPLGGTSNHFRTEVLRALGGWDAFNVTEDCDLGLRISQYGLETAVLDSTTYEEATSRVKIWLFQRSRWIKGYLQTYLVHMRRPLQTLQKGRFRSFFSLQVIVGAWTFVLLVNPIMWLLTVLYILFRPIGLYQLLFPGPVLYIGAFCLIFGNFFYIYTHFLGCLRRREYELIKWVFLLPLYWVLMSISAYIALYQLIVKPHYWEKTQHGNHLQATPGVEITPVVGSIATAERAAYASMPTVRMNTQITEDMLRYAAITAIDPETPTQKTVAIRGTIATQIRQNEQVQNKKREVRFDLWFAASLVIALISSITATIYVFQKHWTLAYGDAFSHMEIGRRIFDSATPGLAQLGGVWLPLPHILIALFAWNDYLWQTGLAGSIVGMGCYLVTAIYVFLAARRLTNNSCAAFIGSLVYILNPNVLYLQATPLTEPVCQATFTMACYYLLAWSQDDKRKYLVLAAGSTFLATLARYDGWVLVVAFPVIISVTGFLKHHSLRKIEGNLITFLTQGCLGIILWLAWCQIIFGDPLYFQHGPFSSQEQTNANAFTEHGKFFLDIQLYSIDTIETLGIVLFIFALIAVLLFAWKHRKRPEVFAALVFLVPFGFYIAALFGGQVWLFNNHVQFHPLGIIPITESLTVFNGRFGSEMVAPAAVFIATLVPIWKGPNLAIHQASKTLLRILLVTIIVLQSAWIAQNGVISVIAEENPPFCANGYGISVYLSQHYNGGYILQGEYPYELSESDAGIDFKNVVYEGSGQLWTKALHQPESTVDWVILAPGNILQTELNHTDPTFTQHFTLVMTDVYGLHLYHKNGLPPLPTRPVSQYLLSEKQICSQTHVITKTPTPLITGNTTYTVWKEEYA